MFTERTNLKRRKFSQLKFMEIKNLILEKKDRIPNSNEMIKFILKNDQFPEMVVLIKYLSWRLI